MALRDLIVGPVNLILTPLRTLCDEVETRLLNADEGVDVASFATGGDGTSGDPWTGMFGAITFQDYTTYRYRKGHYAYTTSPNFLKTDIAHRGEAGVFFHHTGTGDAFILDSEDPGVLWIHRARIENITVLGSVAQLSGTATGAVNTDQVVGTGTSFTTQIAIGQAIAFDSGSGNNETRLVTAIADNTHLTVDGNWTTNKSGTVKVGKTRHGIFMSGVRNAILKNITVHDVANCVLYAEWCVTNYAGLLVSSYHDPTQSTEFQIRSQFGIKLDQNTTTFTFVEPVIEGTQAIGIHTLNGSYGNSFLNGTSEGNKGKGAVFASVGNTIINTDFEANEGLDVEVLQSRNTFINAVIEQSITITAGQGNRIQGGVIGSLVTDGDYTVLDGVEVLGTITGATLATLINLPYVNTLDGSLRPDVRIGNVLDWVKDLTAGATISTNARLGRLQYFLSNQNFTLANPTNGVNGQVITWRITQGASHTITYGNKFRITSAKEFPAMPTVAGEVLYITARYHSTDDKWDIVFANSEIFSIFVAQDVTAQDVNATGGYSVDDVQVLTNQQAAITSFTDNVGGSNSKTLAAIPSPADTPASADALRDDLVANALPSIRNAITSLAVSNEEVLAVLRTHGLIAQTPPFDLDFVDAWYPARLLTFDADALVNKARDFSGNGKHLLQGTLGKRPIFKTNQVNGFPALRFDGSDDEMRTAAFAYAQDRCVSIVMKRFNNAFKYIYSSLDAAGMALFQGDGASNDLVSMFAGTGSGDPSGVIDSGVWYLVTAEYNGSSSNIYENGTLAGDSPGNPGTNNGNGLVLGNRYDSSLPSQIDVAEIVIYDPSIRGDVETFLTGLYGL